MFIAKFVRLADENPLDEEARERRKADGHPVHEPQPKGKRPSFYSGRKRIRDDFAHFNMLNGNRHKNFNYLVNSVRSLLAYDRKMKNAVSESIAGILQDEGLIIQWTLHEGSPEKSAYRSRLDFPTSITSGQRTSRLGSASPKCPPALRRW